MLCCMFHCHQGRQAGVQWMGLGLAVRILSWLQRTAFGCEVSQVRRHQPEHTACKIDS